MAEEESFARLKERIETLEEQLQRLRLSRRILMDLLLAQEQIRRAEIDRLRAENELLRRLNLERKLSLVTRGSAHSPHSEGRGESSSSAAPSSARSTTQRFDHQPWTGL